MNEFIVIFVTAASVAEAEKIARSLIEAGAAPCVTIVPSLLSIYRWKGETRRDQECLMLIKTRRDRFSAVKEIVAALHSYEVPEVIAVPLAEISERYRSYLEGYFEEGA